MDEDYLLLSGIQHFSFCRRQWALIHVENLWDENALTAEGEIIHKRVHDYDVQDIRNGVLTVRGLQVHSERMKIRGVCDAVEFIPDPDGVRLNKRDGTWRICPVEYKHGRSKANDCDRLQVCAQALCLEEMFCCDIPEAYLYYAETRRREKVILDSVHRKKVCDMFDEMRGYIERNYTPKVRPGKSCGKCSLENVCVPELLKRKTTVREYIDKRLYEVSE
ncbi:MAG: CRISPR-associated protein Cas4 [Clostridia bacterium]|nr:CRISPR-associated protein Cas4 [Clostridia bacterium]